MHFHNVQVIENMYFSPKCGVEGKWIYTSGNLSLLKTITTVPPIMTGSFHDNFSESSWPLNSPESSFVGSETEGGASVIKVAVKCI